MFMLISFRSGQVFESDVIGNVADTECNYLNQVRMDRRLLSRRELLAVNVPLDALQALEMSSINRAESSCWNVSASFADWTFHALFDA
jgi:hypothetical protein